MLIPRGVDEDKLLFIDDGGMTLSYGGFSSFLDDFISIVPGGRRLGFLFAENSIGSLAHYLACLESARVVPLILDSSIATEIANELIKRYEPEFLIAPEGHEATAGMQRVSCSFGYEVCSTEALPCEIYDDLALLLSTSGSTGDSKLVRLSYKNILANAESIVSYLGIDANERPITSLPMNYTYGLSVINSHVLVGATLLVTNQSVLQRGFWEFFSAQNATSFAGVPYTYQMLKRLRMFNRDLPSLKVCTQAGGRLDPELQREFGEWASETGRQFVVMYGQTEATARMSYLPWERCLEKVGSIGIPIPGGEFSLVDEHDEIISEAGIEGELVYTGPNVSLGYATCRDDLSKGDERQGVLHTGDLARRDSEGFYYITGRASRFLKLFGKRINLVTCEELVSHHFECSCVCSGRDDLLVAYVTQEGIDGEVGRYLAKTMGVHISAIKVSYIATIPRSSSGKVLYRELPVV